MGGLLVGKCLAGESSQVLLLGHVGQLDQARDDCSLYRIVIWYG